MDILMTEEQLNENMNWFVSWGDRYFNMNYIIRRISPPQYHPWQGNKMILELFLW